MDPPRLATVAVVSMILFLTLLTGPTMGLIAVPEESPFGGSGAIQGNASIGDVEFPEDASLSRGGSGQYVLRVGAAIVPIESVRGTPGLVYRIDISHLWYSRTSLTVLDEETRGLQSIQLPKATLAADSVDRDTYPARLQILVRGAGNARVVAARNVTVSVRE